MQWTYRPVHSQICQTFPSFSPYALYRPPTYRIHRPPLNSFRFAFTNYGISQPTSPNFWQNQFLNLANRSIRGSVSRRYPFIPLLGLSVLWNWPYKLLSILYFYFTASRLTFSVRNVSHPPKSLYSRKAERGRLECVSGPSTPFIVPVVTPLFNMNLLYIPTSVAVSA